MPPAATVAVALEPRPSPQLTIRSTACVGFCGWKVTIKVAVWPSLIGELTVASRPLEKRTSSRKNNWLTSQLAPAARMLSGLPAPGVGSVVLPIQYEACTVSGASESALISIVASLPLKLAGTATL